MTSLTLSTDGSTSEDPSSPTDPGFWDIHRRALHELRQEIVAHGLSGIPPEREAQLLCRLAFSVCPKRASWFQSVRQTESWIDDLDPSWAMEHLVMAPSWTGRGKVVTALMREMAVALDEAREAPTCARVRITTRGMRLMAVGPQAALSPVTSRHFYPPSS